MKRISVLFIFVLLGLELSYSQNIETVGWTPIGRPSPFACATFSGNGIVFPELNFGTFRRELNPSFFGGASVGIRVPISNLSLQGTFGFAGIQNVPRTLGTSFEFRSTAGVRWNADSYIIHLRLTHFSNARKVFGFRGPNLGENFLTLNIQWIP